MNRWVWIKGGLAGAGLVLGLFGMAWDFRPLVWAALALLALAFVARFVERRERRAGTEDAAPSESR